MANPIPRIMTRIGKTITKDRSSSLAINSAIDPAVRTRRNASKYPADDFSQPLETFLKVDFTSSSLFNGSGLGVTGFSLW